MSKGTKQNPLSFHFLLAELANDNNENIYYKHHYNDISDVKYLNNTHVKIKSRVYTLSGSRFKKGAIKVYTTKCKKDLSVNTQFEEIFRIYIKSPADFQNYKKDVTVIKKGYKECLGGGWSSNINLYEYKGVYYAKLECSTYMHGEYFKASGLDKFKKLNT